MIIIRIISNLLLIALMSLLLLLGACSPSKRISRILKHNPDILETSVTKIDKIIILDAIKDSLSVKKDTSMTDIDQVLNNHGVTDQSVHTDIKKAIIKRKVIKDTIIVTKDSLRVTVSDNGGDIKVKVEKPEKQIKVPQTIITKNTLKVTKKVPRIYKMFAWICATLFVVAVIKYILKIRG